MPKFLNKNRGIAVDVDVKITPTTNRIRFYQENYEKEVSGLDYGEFTSMFIGSNGDSGVNEHREIVSVQDKLVALCIDKDDTNASKIPGVIKVSSDGNTVSSQFVKLLVDFFHIDQTAIEKYIKDKNGVCVLNAKTGKYETRMKNETNTFNLSISKEVLDFSDMVIDDKGTTIDGLAGYILELQTQENPPADRLYTKVHPKRTVISEEDLD